MRNRMCILLLSAALCASPSAMPVMAESVQSEAEDKDRQEDTATDQTVSDAGLQESDESADVGNVEDHDQEVTDAEERKAIDEKAAASVDSFEPVMLPEQDVRHADETAAATEETRDNSTETTGNAESGSWLDAEDYFSFAKQLDENKEETASLDVKYADAPMEFNVDLLSGMTDYRGPLTVNVEDASSKLMYSVQFPEEVWQEDVIDLSASVTADKKTQNLSFRTKQEFPFIVAVSFPALKPESRYLLSDADDSEYGLAHSDADNMIQFQLPAFKDYVIKDAGSHKYDSMDPAMANDGVSPASYIRHNKATLIAAVAAAAMIVFACLVPVRKRKC